MGIKSGPAQWICCQLGAREHYSVPRALWGVGRLRALVTDVWCRPGHPVRALSPGLRERFDPELARAPVRQSTIRLLLFETWAAARRLSGWRLILARNEWFQRQAIRQLARLSSDRQSQPSDPVLFAYSYAARDIFHFARSRGWKTVMGQIDP